MLLLKFNRNKKSPRLLQLSIFTSLLTRRMVCNHLGYRRIIVKCTLRTESCRIKCFKKIRLPSAGKLELGPFRGIP